MKKNNQKQQTKILKKIAGKLRTNRIVPLSPLQWKTVIKSKLNCILISHQIQSIISYLWLKMNFMTGSFSTVLFTALLFRRGILMGMVEVDVAAQFKRE